MSVCYKGVKMCVITCQEHCHANHYHIWWHSPKEGDLIRYSRRSVVFQVTPQVWNVSGCLVPPIFSACREVFVCLLLKPHPHLCGLSAPIFPWLLRNVEMAFPLLKAHTLQAVHIISLPIGQWWDTNPEVYLPYLTLSRQRGKKTTWERQEEEEEEETEKTKLSLNLRRTRWVNSVFPVSHSASVAISWHFGKD